MGFSKVQAAVSEYLNSKAFCKACIKVNEVIAAVLTLFCLINVFVWIPFIGNLIPYFVMAAVVFAFASDGKLGLLIATGSQALVAFIALIQGLIAMSKWGGAFASFPFSTLLDLLFWGTLTYFVVYAISKDGMGNSMIINSFKSSAAAKAPARKCPSCGLEETNPASAFCRSCGTKLPDAAPAKVVCPSCGKTVDADADFCVICGTKLK